MQWQVKQGDILDEPADVLICSANPFLTLSGGVGGALLLRYGQHLQRELEAHLASTGKRFMEQGSVVLTRPDGVPYLGIIHAVAVDGMYESSPQIVERVVQKSLHMASDLGARHIALTALATGYGRLRPSEFAAGLRQLSEQSFSTIEHVAIVVRKSDEVDEIKRVLSLAT